MLAPMPSDLPQPAPPPPALPPWELRLADWAGQLGVTPQDLRSALEEVGPLMLD